MANKNILEDQIKNDDVMIPDSLRPDKVEEMLNNLNPEEMNRRSNSEDVPVINKSVNTNKNDKNNYKRVVLPIVLAAAFVLTLGLGYVIGIKRGSRLDDVNQQTTEAPNQGGKKDTTKKTTKPEKEDKEDLISSKKNGNYKKAYDVLEKYNDYLSVDYAVEEEVDYAAVEEEVEETADEAPREAANNYKGTETTGLAGASDDKGVDYTDTNVRTEGVAEADIVKTDGNYIYEYDSYTEHLNIYSVKDGKIEKKSRTNILGIGVTNAEMYINGDKLIFVGDNADDYDYNERKTAVVIYDVSDRENPEKSKVIMQDGYFDSSRLVDGILYTFSKKSFPLDKMSRKKYETYIPTVDGELIENEDLVIKDDGYINTYVVISSIDLDKEEIKDKVGLLAGSETLYVSANNIYLTDRNYDWTSYRYNETTSIIKLSYDDGKIEYETNGSVPGYLNNDYSIDEYDGYLRMVVTYYEDYEEYNGLYILDDELSKVSVIKHLAEGETIRSARFMGKTAYFVTFRQTDPLFAVDLSDPENPEILDYLKIPGFSAYMHPYAEGLLLGIGYDADEYGSVKGLKLSMFDISDPENVKEVDKMVIDKYETASVLADRRAFMFDNQNGVFGFSVAGAWNYEVYDDDGIARNDGYYTVFDYDEKEGFQRKMEYRLSDDYSNGFSYESMNATRGMIIGDYLYVVESGEGVVSFTTDTFEQFDECH